MSSKLGRTSSSYFNQSMVVVVVSSCPRARLPGSSIKASCGDGLEKQRFERFGKATHNLDKRAGIYRHHRRPP